MNKPNISSRSGKITSHSHLVAFLYDLIRDHLPAGVIEEMMLDLSDEGYEFDNGWIAQYAIDIANRLENNRELPEVPEDFIK